MKRATITATLLFPLCLGVGHVPDWARPLPTFGSCKIDDALSAAYGAIGTAGGRTEGEDAAADIHAYERLVAEAAPSAAPAGENTSEAVEQDLQEVLDGDLLAGSRWKPKFSNAGEPAFLQPAMFWGAGHFSPHGAPGARSTALNGSGDDTGNYSGEGDREGQADLTDTPSSIGSGGGYSQTVEREQDTVQVPEPGTLGMLAVGLLGVALAMRRRAAFLG
jgi:hypothetical protein